MFCQNCGVRSIEGASYCTSCGQQLILAQKKNSSDVAKPSPTERTAKKTENDQSRFSPTPNDRTAGELADPKNWSFGNLDGWRKFVVTFSLITGALALLWALAGIVAVSNAPDDLLVSGSLGILYSSFGGAVAWTVGHMTIKRNVRALWWCFGLHLLMLNVIHGLLTYTAISRTKKEMSRT